MHLIDIHTFELKQFIGNDVPPYVILSHRWGEEELTFKDVLKKRMDVNTAGYRKLIGACEKAEQYDVDFLWIDTCCIDKRSSAELSEAINSMFAWYKRAEVCIAFLEDVIAPELEDFDHRFRNSVWFTRAWTLQELLAPEYVDFFDRDWQPIGSKESRVSMIQEITLIPVEALTQAEPLDHWPVALRMSWASNREATRNEDIAYSLLGIFDINMPLLYGEDHKAFDRLQEEILRHSTDQSILLHSLGEFSNKLLAASPNDFRSTGNHETGDHKWHNLVKLISKRPGTLSSAGLTVELRLFKWGHDTFAVLLNGPNPRSLLLFQRRPAGGQDCYVRLKSFRDDPEIQSAFSWYETRVVTLFRPVISHFVHHRPPHSLNGFAIYENQQSRVPYQLLSSSPPSRSLYQESDVRWSSCVAPDRSYSYPVCTFDTFRKPGVVRLQIGQPPVLWLDATFDFDGRTCILVRDSPELINFQGYENVDLPKICGLLSDQMTNTKSSSLGHRREGWEKLQDEKTGRLSYFVRRGYVHTEFCCQVPGFQIFVGLTYKTDGGLPWRCIELSASPNTVKSDS